jgi:hypothetical protein
MSHRAGHGARDLFDNVIGLKLRPLFAGFTQFHEPIHHPVSDGLFLFRHLLKVLSDLFARFVPALFDIFFQHFLLSHFLFSQSQAYVQDLFFSVEVVLVDLVQVLFVQGDVGLGFYFEIPFRAAHSIEVKLEFQVDVGLS